MDRAPPPVPRVHGSVSLTRGFRVAVWPSFLAEHSDAAQRRFVFAYRVRITNESAAPARLLSRRWLITDGDGVQRIVEGEGVVGERPRLDPGACFTYSSFCPLPTPTGSMEGAYTMRAGSGGEGETFEVEIGRFFLIAPGHEPA